MVMEKLERCDTEEFWEAEAFVGNMALILFEIDIDEASTCLEWLVARI